MNNYYIVIEFLKSHIIETVLTVIVPALFAFLRIIRPRLLFYTAIRFLEMMFKIQFSEIFFVSENAILKRIKEDTFSNRTALIRFKHNGSTEIDVLNEVRSVDRDLEEINSTTAEQYREMIDDLTVTKKAKIFNNKTERHANFYQLIIGSFNCTSFALIPVYQNSAIHEAIVILVAFDNHKIFDKNLLDKIKIDAAKIAKISFLIR